MMSPLRRPTPQDEAALAGLFMEPDNCRYLGGPRSRERAVASARELISAQRALPAWVVVQDGAVEPVGFVCLDRHHDGEDVEVSFMLSSVARGRGLGRAAVLGALDAAWGLGLPRVVAETQAANGRSVRLLEALGFVRQRALVRFGEPQLLYAIDRPGGVA